MKSKTTQSQTCPGGGNSAEVSLAQLEQTLHRSRNAEGEVHFIHFWRSLGEVSRAEEQEDEKEAREETLEPEANYTLPIGPLGPAPGGSLHPARVRPSESTEALKVQQTRHPQNPSVMRELEELRDVMLDHFEAQASTEIPMVLLHEAVQQAQLRSAVPEFWQKLDGELQCDGEAGQCINLADLTVFLLLWLGKAASWDLPAENAPVAAGGTCEASEDLSMLAQHLQQALDSPRQDNTRSHPSVAVSPRSGNESSLHQPNFRSAMLNLSCEMADLAAGCEAPDRNDGDARGWMRSALLPLKPRCGYEADRTEEQEDTMPLPVSRQPGLRDAARSLLNDDTCPADQNTGDLGEGWKQLMPNTAPDFARTAVRPSSPSVPSLEPLEARAPVLPVFLHIYDVTQEPAIQRLNKVLAHKRMPLKFGGIFHAGVEVSGTEWSYGCTESEDEPGVLPNLPRMHPDHHYRQTVEMRRTNLFASQVGDVLEELSIQYTGPTYDLLRKNCCHFADDFCQRLGAGCIPAWVYRLARIAARIENLLQAAQRIRTG